jgi:hypothetical protein
VPGNGPPPKESKLNLACGNRNQAVLVSQGPGASPHQPSPSAYGKASRQGAGGAGLRQPSRTMTWWVKKRLPPWLPSKGPEPEPEMAAVAGGSLVMTNRRQIKSDCVRSFMKCGRPEVRNAGIDPLPQDHVTEK